MIPKKEILTWKRRYNRIVDRKDREVERVLGRKFRQKGEVTLRDLKQLTKWKFEGVGGRVGLMLSYVAKNKREDVLGITRRALRSQDDHERVETLMELHGVGPAMASVILTFYAPGEYGVMDIHVWRQLFPRTEITFTTKSYIKLLKKLRKYKQKYGLRARTVEQALYAKGYIEKHRCK